MRAGFHAGPAARAVAPVVVAAALAHIGPAATWLPELRRRRFPGLAGQGPPRPHQPSPSTTARIRASTPHFLDVLDALGRATFFVLGENVTPPGDGTRTGPAGARTRRPRLVARPPLAAVAGAGRARADACRPRGGRGRRTRVPRWYRPPYGILTSGRWAAARRAGTRPVLWTAWGKDWRQDATPASVRATVAADLRGGGTILLHDTDHVSAPGSWRAALGALPRHRARDCREAGWAVGPPGEHGVIGAEERGRWGSERGVSTSAGVGLGHERERGERAGGGRVRCGERAGGTGGRRAFR